MIYSYVKLRETFICFIFIAIPFHYIQLRYAVKYIVKGIAIKILIPVNHQLSLFVCPKHMKSDNWLCLFILLVINFAIKIEILLIIF